MKIIAIIYLTWVLIKFILLLESRQKIDLIFSVGEVVAFILSLLVVFG
jgi:hypothetical protein